MNADSAVGRPVTPVQDTAVAEAATPEIEIEYVPEVIRVE